MPALPIIADTFRCTLNWTNGAGQIAENVIHIRTNTPGHPQSDIFELLQDTITTNMWASTGIGAVIQSVDILPLDGVTATQNFVTGGGAQWGGGGVGQIMPAVATIVKLTTPHRGRSYRGRVYVPFTSEAAAAAGVLDPGTQALQFTDWTLFPQNLGLDATTPSELVVASYKLALATDVSAVSVESFFGTQRRRQGRLRGA